MYWTADPGIVERLNAILPDEFHTPWDSVRMLLPINQTQTYHPVYPYELISQMGYDAFCSSLRSEERRSFITVEDIAKIRDRRYAELLNPVFLYLLNYLAPYQSHHLPSMFSNLHPCSIPAIVGDALHPLPILSVVDLALNP